VAISNVILLVVAIPILVWFFGYLLPAGAAYGFASFLPRRANSLFTYQLVVMHAALLVSIAITQYSMYVLGLAFPWHADSFSLFWYILVAITSASMLGGLGIWYGISAFVQQLTMLSTAFLLLPVFPLYAVVLLIMPVYVTCHFLRLDWTLVRVSLFASWGVASVVLFAMTSDFLLTVTLHTLFGSLLIKRGVLYAPREHVGM
jgi:hypothetical protein